MCRQRARPVERARAVAYETQSLSDRLRNVRPELPRFSFAIRMPRVSGQFVRPSSNFLPPPTSLGSDRQSRLMPRHVLSGLRSEEQDLFRTTAVPPPDGTRHACRVPQPVFRMSRVAHLDFARSFPVQAISFGSPVRSPVHENGWARLVKP